jgi:hypothetical protein
MGRLGISPVVSLGLRMLEFTDFIYLDLEKTGCTFLREALAACCTDKPVRDAKHAPLEALPAKPRIMTIRNPLNYFLSLWKYGLDGRGGFYGAYHESHPQAYADRSPRSFRSFLNLALAAGNMPSRVQPLYTDVYTARILNQLVPLREREAFLAALAGDLSPGSLLTRLEGFLPDVLLRTESLNRDFHVLVDAGRMPFLRLRPDWKSVFPLDAGKTNYSSGDTESAVSDYYEEWHRERVTNSCALAMALHARASALLQAPSAPTG